MTRPGRPYRHRLAAAACALGCVLAAGCRPAERVGLLMRSLRHGTAVAPQWRTAVYDTQDEQTLDVFLSDITLDELLAAPGTQPPRGHLVHIHQFYVPSAGKTPQDPSASNATLRHMILAGTQRGVYGGAGLLRPTGSAQDGEYDATLSGATTRLVLATSGFRNALPTAIATGAVSAERNPEAVRRLTDLWDRRTAGLSAPVADAND